MKWLSLLRSSHVISKFLHSLFRSVCLSCFKIKMSDRIKPNGWTLDPLIPVDRTIPHAYKNAFRTEFLGTLANPEFLRNFPIEPGHCAKSFWLMRNKGSHGGVTNCLPLPTLLWILIMIIHGTLCLLQTYSIHSEPRLIIQTCRLAQRRKEFCFWRILLEFKSAAVWKFQDFPVTQILREINFGDCRS